MTFLCFMCKMKIIEFTPQNYSKEQIINTYKAFSMEPITQLLFNSVSYHFLQCSESFRTNMGSIKNFFRHRIPEMLPKKQMATVMQGE